MRRNNIFKLVTVAAWISITVIAYATLTHVGFVYPIYFKLSPILMRPKMRNYAHFDHLIPFAVVGGFFSFPYPRRTILVCCIAFGGAALLEFFQTLTPDRHGALVLMRWRKWLAARRAYFQRDACSRLAGRYWIS